MNNILISIIIPAFNAENTIERCINSIAESINNIKLITDEACEVVCVNDGSSDGTAEKLYNAAKKYNFLKIVNQDNCGAGGQEMLA